MATSKSKLESPSAIDKDDAADPVKRTFLVGNAVKAAADTHSRLVDTINLMLEIVIRRIDLSGLFVARGGVMHVGVSSCRSHHPVCRRL